MTFSLWFVFIYFTVVNVQLPLIMFGSQLQGFHKVIGTWNTERIGWAVQEVNWRYRVTEGKAQGKRHGQTNYCTGCEEALFLGKYIPHAASAQQTIWPLCVHLYIIYSIYLYMYIIIFIYVLFSDKKVPHAMPHLIHSSV